VGYSCRGRGRELGIQQFLRGREGVDGVEGKWKGMGWMG